jgi:Uma2 family endonuclease
MMATFPMSGGMIAHDRNGPIIGRNPRMHMALKTQRWTRADLERLPDDGNTYEVIDGELLVSPAPRPAHEEVIHVFGSALAAYCQRTRIATAYHGKSAMVTETSEVQPDIVVRKRVVPPPDRWDDVPLPLLIAEVLSESTRRYDLIKKRAFYMENGVPEYWIIDGDARTVRVVTPAGERTEVATLRWHPVASVDALEIDLTALFEEALGDRRIAV